MDFAKVLIELKEELAVLDAAIVSLERLQHVRPGSRAADTRQPAHPAVRRKSARPVEAPRQAE
jgi:hypothetical protein